MSTYRVSLGVVLAALCLVTLRMTGVAQTASPQSAQPTFRSTLDLLTLDTSVRDKSGQPVSDLQASDFNVPTSTLFFFHAGNLSRFSFRRTGRERIDGVDTIVVDFREERTPTLVMNGAGKDVPASGTLWVNPEDGMIVRTRLELKGFDSAGSRALVDVVYRKDAAMAMWVPSRMTERYTAGTQTTTTTATYTDFKRFQTSVKIK